jgi:crotonobetainyl-CoA:carnitine CoA-transferase CaiB-like acyl-CoA transferase
VLPGVQVGDLGGGGMLGAIGILAALIEARATGRGQFVDASMLDGVVSWLSIHAGTYLATGDEPASGTAPLGGGLACYGVYRARDGRYLTVGALEPRFWGALCGVLGHPELVPEQFAQPERQREMASTIQEAFSTRDRDDWLARFADVEACVGPVNSVGEALADLQVRARGMVAEVQGVPVGPGPVPRVGGPSEEPLRPAPALGEHTAEVLSTVGVTEGQLAALRAAHVV